MEGSGARGATAVSEASELATFLAQAAIDKKATDVTIIDVSGLVAYTDIIIVCTGRNSRQVRAIAEEMRVRVKKDRGLFPLSIEGARGSRWVLADFDDVVVHIFDPQSRVFYDLEGLWADAPRLEAPPSGAPAEDEPLFSFP